MLALIKCPECGKDISDTVKSCIHCGYMINPKENETSATINQQDNNIKNNNNSEEAKKPKSKFKIGCGIIISIFLIFAAIFIFDAIYTAQQEIKIAEAQYNKKAEIMNYHQILADWDANSIAFKSKYGGNRYKGVGIVEYIFNDKIGIYIPCTCGKSHYADISLEKESEKAKIPGIKKGDIIEFEATKSGQYTTGFDYGIFSVKE